MIGACTALPMMMIMMRLKSILISMLVCGCGTGRHRTHMPTTCHAVQADRRVSRQADRLVIDAQNPT